MPRTVAARKSEWGDASPPVTLAQRAEFLEQCTAWLATGVASEGTPFGHAERTSAPSQARTLPPSPIGLSSADLRLYAIRKCFRCHTERDVCAIRANPFTSASELLACAACDAFIRRDQTCEPLV